MTKSSIRLTIREDRFATATFDSVVNSANVLTIEMWRDLEKILRLVAGQSGIQGLILKSAKPNIFIAGADLELLANARNNDPRVRETIDQGNRVLSQLEGLPFPTCALIDGAALGGGLEIALACDFILMGTNPKVKLGLPEVKFGLIPGWGGTQRLPRVIGLALATELICKGRTLNPIEAAEIDLAIGPILSESLLASAMKVLQIPGWQAARRQKQEWIPAEVRAAFQPNLGDLDGAARRALNAILLGAELPLNSALGIETEEFFQLVGTTSSKRLISAFFSKN